MKRNLNDPIAKFQNLGELTQAFLIGAFRGMAVNIMVLHDDHCVPGNCTCCPEYVVEPLTTENYLRAQREQAAWLRSKLH